MTCPSKTARFNQFIQLLNAAPAAASRQAAFDLLKKVMDSVEDACGLPANDYVKRMHIFPMEDFYDWKDLAKDPCSWVDSVAASHRTEIYNSGRIVITRIKHPAGLVLDKPGA